jgi:uncharacterized protein YkwD
MRRNGSRFFSLMTSNLKSCVLLYMRGVDVLEKQHYLNGITLTLVALIVSCLMAAACAPIPFEEPGLGKQKIPDQTVSKAKPRIDIGALEQRIHVLINQQRAKHGLSSLDWNPALNKIARLHSKDMATKRYFQHNSPEGHDLAYRYSQQGFVCEIAVGAMYYTGGENIFQTNLYSSVEYINEIPTIYHWNDIETMAQTTVKGWMNSPSHRETILEPSWRTEGIGIGISNDNKVYITQDFC